MVSTRRSAEKKKKEEQEKREDETVEEEEEEKAQGESDNRDDDEPQDEREEQAGGNSSSTTSPRSERAQQRNARRKRHQQELRSKSTGIGLVISTQTVNKKKTVFTESVVVEGGSIPKDALVAKDDDDVHSNEEPSDDDAVEEIKGDIAMQYAIEQRDQERATARASAELKSRKKRKKNKKDLAAEDLDDDFFAQLDQERELERKKQRKEEKEKKKEPTGKHTTFVLSGDDERSASGGMTTMEADHNIEVTVLDASSSDRNLHPPPSESKATEEMLIYSRSLLIDGSEPASRKQIQKAKKAGHRTVQAPTWKRSKKMNRLLAPGARRRQANRTTGQAAAHFVVKL